MQFGCTGQSLRCSSDLRRCDCSVGLVWILISIIGIYEGSYDGGVRSDYD